VIAPAHPSSIASAEHSATAAMRRLGYSEDATQSLLAEARSLLPPDVYLRALTYRADSMLLTWPECVYIARLFEAIP
jgi:hypothetical protein